MNQFKWTDEAVRSFVRVYVGSGKKEMLKGGYRSSDYRKKSYDEKLEQFKKDYMDRESRRASFEDFKKREEEKLKRKLSEFRKSIGIS